MLSGVSYEHRIRLGAALRDVARPQPAGERRRRQLWVVYASQAACEHDALALTRINPSNNWACERAPIEVRASRP